MSKVVLPKSNKPIKGIKQQLTADTKIAADVF